ncbi:TetR/AcrR family transcriptional regulator [Nocardia noduli]|uniref:TetR/AcrR family transcriptional regulator n=1 Tax=Nocardia noduli TaxID=2815722 RepID=UPI001C215733|nr:TetR/AcrR family transcriptional regulator [Nocardia noduli]
MSSDAVPKRGRPVRARREDIVAAATRMLVFGGAEALSMRGLADDLGVSTAALYHHFPTKAALTIAVLSARADELPRPELPDEPRARLIAVSDHLVEVLYGLPWVVELLVSGDSYGRSAMWILDEFVRSARRLGADDEYAGFMYNVVWRFVLGELAVRRSEDERREREHRGISRPRWTEQADADLLAEFPDAVRLLPKWNGIRTEYRTVTALQRVIDGLLDGIRATP